MTRTVVEGAGACEHSACPAPAISHVTIHGRRFMFCNHHAIEVESALMCLAARADEAARHAREHAAARKAATAASAPSH